MQQLSVRLDDKTMKLLNDLAEKTGRSKTYYVKEAIISQIDDMQDYYIGIKTLKEFKESGAEPISADELYKELGLK